MKPYYRDDDPLRGGTKVMYLPDLQSGGVIFGGPGVRVIRLEDFEANKAKMDRGEPFKDPPEYAVPVKALEKPGKRGRPRQYHSNAERQKAYRRRKAMRSFLYTLDRQGGQGDPTGGVERAWEGE
jgi:hypothetical protein